MNLQYIPLSLLQPTSLNARKKSNESIDDLLASIPIQGLLQNLVVTKGDAPGQGVAGGYLVVAGGRRLKALLQLAETGALPRDLAEDGIPCMVIERPAASEASLAENVIRVSMHPADEFDAYRGLIESGGFTVEDVAARFGQSEIYVRQRLKLANVAPELIQLYRDEKMKLRQVMALALSDDHQLQLRVWKAAKGDWQREPDRLREAITQKQLAVNSPLAKFVGIQAYETAGGHVLRDIFGKEEDAYLSDVELLNKLALAKLERTAEKMRKEGWAWVDTRIKFDWADKNTFGEAKSERKGSKQTWSADAKAHAGVVLSVSHNGQTDIERGLVRPEDRRAAAKATGSSISGGKEPKAKHKPGQLSFAAIQRLQAEGSNIIAVELAKQPTKALALLAAELGDTVFHQNGYGYGGPRTWIHIRREASGRMPGKIAQISGRGKDADHLAEQEKSWREQIPKKRDELRPWILQQDLSTILRLLSFLVAKEIDVVDVTSSAKQGIVELAAATEVDLSNKWKPSVEWLATLPKSAILTMAKEAGAGDIALTMLTKAPKAKLPELALQLFPEGWLPKPLRPRAPKTLRASVAASKSARDKTRKSTQAAVA